MAVKVIRNKVARSPIAEVAALDRSADEPFAEPERAEIMAEADSELEGSEPEEAPVGIESTDVEILFNEKEGTATGTLSNGVTITAREPKTKDFIYFTSQLETAPAYLRSGTMSVFWLTHLMLTEARDSKGKSVELPDFDGFLDWLEDTDTAVVGGIFRCFPDVGERYAKFARGMA